MTTTTSTTTLTSNKI